MVAISLYRGNLHRVPPDTPRQWVMPRRSISTKDFRNLLRRRSKALSILNPSATQLPLTTSDPPPPLPQLVQPPSSALSLPPQPEGKSTQGAGAVPNSSASEDPPKDETSFEDRKDGEGGDCVGDELKKSVVLCGGGGEVKVEEVEEEEDKDKKQKKKKGSDMAGEKDDCKAEDNSLVVKVEEQEEQKTRDAECDDKGETGDGKEKRKKEIVEELEVLNKKKHNLVQLLKQILNAEEELKRRNSTQVPPRPSLPLQVDVPNDSGSLTRQPTPRLGSDANAADIKGEADDGSNPSLQPRQLHRMSSTSPSAESMLRRPPHFQQQVPHPSRASALAAGSPSRFAHPGIQSSAHPPALQTVSASGTNYIASSPSPAASGGTSSFRDTRQPSPWN